MHKPPLKKEGYLCIGVIAGAHGIKGEIRIKPYINDIDGFVTYAVPEKFDGSAYLVNEVRQGPKGFVLAKVPAVNSRTDAEAQRGIALYLKVDQLPDLQTDEYYFAELQGLAVVKEDGSPFGKLLYVFDNGAHPVLNIRAKGKEICLPFTDDVVISVDLDEKQMVVSDMADEFVDI